MLFSIGKAMTEKSILYETSRERNIWWKFFMKEYGGKPFPSCNTELIIINYYVLP